MTTHLPLPSTHWWWIRHAPVPGAAGRLFGHQDVSCDTADAASFRALAAILPEDPVWLVTPLRRTRETLAAIAAARGENPPPEPEVVPALIEQTFGRWEGLRWEEMETLDPPAMARFWQDPVRTAPPAGESFCDLIARVRAETERLTRVHAGRCIVAVSHGGPIRAAVALALDLRPEAAMAIVIDNLSVTRLSHVEDGLLRGRGGVWQVRGVNQPSRWT
ncbi:MAG: histidine phosphatase family protein [Rhodospirillales bacterium]|nr:MAG: histidine phosphatase family protein [Rhodospirillales bacterium]